MKNNYKFIFILLAFLCQAFSSHAAEMDMNMAQMQAMDKITGRVNLIEVPVNGEVKFGTFSVVVRSCKTRSEEEIPENFAFVDVTDKSFDKEEFNIFKGWMFSSSPAVHAVEHPIYDVWLIKCFNGNPQPEQLLSEEILLARDNLPRLQDIHQQQPGEDTEIAVQPQNTIEFKDTMYKEEKHPVSQEKEATETNDGPVNLLHINENYDEPQEETIVIPAAELSEAMNIEAENLQKQNMQQQKEAETIAPIDELTAAIEAELAQQQK